MAIELALSSNSKLRRVIWLSSLAVLVLTVIGTQSRGGTLGLAAVGGYLWLRSPRKGLSLTLALVAVTVILTYAPDEYFNRMQTISAYEEDGSAMGRITAWKAAVQMCLDHPLSGVGAGMFPVSFGTDYRPNEHMPWLTAHSMYFLVLGELGLPGIVVLLGLTLGNLLANRRVANAQEAQVAGSRQRLFPIGSSRLLYLLSASMIGFAVCGAFLSVAYYPHLFVLSGLMISARCVAVGEQGVAEPASAPGPAGLVRVRSLQSAKKRGMRGGPSRPAPRVATPCLHPRA
jgi:probable O-glycosylation ligase (exosortase A-associated)